MEIVEQQAADLLHLADGPLGQEVAARAGVADFLLDASVDSLPRPAEIGNLSLKVQADACQQVDQGGLPCPVLPNDRYQLRWTDGKAHMPKGIFLPPGIAE